MTFLPIYIASTILSIEDPMTQRFAAFFGVGFSAPFILGLVMGGIPLFVVVLMAFFIVTLFIYCWLIPRTDKIIMPILSELEGLKLYLKTAEQDRFDTLNPPTKDLVFYERLLPYAIALGVENQWTDQFTEALSASEYAPTWVVGDTDNVMSARFFKRFYRDLQRNMASSTAYVTQYYSSSSSSRRSSSGSSGRGSSGGGGGGGGGGGW